MILIINTCEERLHFNEFVKPVGDILVRNNIKGFIRKYDCVNKRDVERAEKIIICGTSLKDNEFLNNVNKFEWIKDIKKPILGICAGMQIIGLVFGGNLNKKEEIGFYHENFQKDFLGINGDIEVYHLHNNYVNFSRLKDFEVFCSSNEVDQAVKHKRKEIYGVLFHPEARNKEMIRNFCSS